MAYILFICGPATAIAAWILLTQHFFPDSIPTQDSKNEEKWEECTDEDILREAVRLAELKIEEFSQGIRILEHKAIALVTLCFAIMGYFYTFEWLDYPFSLLRAIALIVLSFSSLAGIGVLFLEFIGIARINPKASLWRAKYHESNDNTDDCDKENKNPNLSKLLLYTLKEYHDAIETTKKTKNKKSALLENAIRFLLAGISFLIGWTVAKSLLLLL